MPYTGRAKNFDKFLYELFMLRSKRDKLSHSALVLFLAEKDSRGMIAHESIEC